jgi:hypothetical protein
MKKGTILLILALAASSIFNNAFANGSGGGSHYSGGSHTSSHSSSGSHSSNYHGRSYSTGSSAHGYYSSGSHHDATTHSKAAVGVERDSHGRVKRSEEAKKEFMKQSGYPHGRPGYVVDHIIPLKRGGADSPSNMQWQTIEEAKQKDKWE